MGRPREYISKAEFAAGLQLSKGRITQLIGKGLPVRADGKVNRAEAERWYRANIQERSVKPGPKRPQAAPTSAAAAGPLVDSTRDVKVRFAGWRYLFEQLIAESARIPKILVEAGFQDPVLLTVAPSAFVDLVFHLAEPCADCAYNWLDGDDRSPNPLLSIPALAKKHGFAFDPEAVRAAADAIEERIGAAILK